MIGKGAGRGLALALAAWALLGAGMFVFLAQGVPARIHALAEQGLAPNPYWQPQHALLLYLGAPLGGLAAALLLLGPGLGLALAIDGGRCGLAGLVFRGYAFSVAGLGGGLVLLERLLPAPLDGRAFLFLLLVLGATGILAATRARRNGPPLRELLQAHVPDILLALALPVLLLALLAPKFHWEDLNGDGAHLFLVARNLIETGRPTWPGPEGAPALYAPEIMLEVLNASLFMRLLGENLLAIRLPMVMGTGLLALAVMAHLRRGTSLGGAAPALAVGGVLLLFAYVLAFQASYNPYFADIALPAAREPFVSFLFLGMVWFFLRRDAPWTALMAGLLAFTVPSAPLLVGFWLAASFLVLKPRPAAGLFRAALLGLALALVLAKLLPPVLAGAGLIEGGAEFGGDSILRRLRFITLSEPGRILFWLLPGGILPAFGLLLWKWQDGVARALTLTTLAYVAFFQFQAYRVMPHHFSPAMILPLIVFFRLRPLRAAPRAPALALGLAALVAGWLSRPPDVRPHMETDAFARLLEMRGMEESGHGKVGPMLLSRLLAQAFPVDFTSAGADAVYTVSPLAVAIHLEIVGRAPSGREGAADYELRPVTAPSRFADPVLLAETGGIGLYARDRRIYARDRKRSPEVRSIGNPLYFVPREVIFGHGRREGPRSVWDIADLLK